MGSHMDFVEGVVQSHDPLDVRPPRNVSYQVGLQSHYITLQSHISSCHNIIIMSWKIRIQSHVLSQLTLYIWKFHMPCNLLQLCCSSLCHSTMLTYCIRVYGYNTEHFLSLQNLTYDTPAAVGIFTSNVLLKVANETLTCSATITYYPDPEFTSFTTTKTRDGVRITIQVITANPTLQYRNAKGQPLFVP